MFKSSFIYHIYTRAKRVLIILKEIFLLSNTAAFFLYRGAVRESMSYLVLSIPSKVFLALNSVLGEWAQHAKVRSFLRVFKYPGRLQVRFYGAAVCGIFLGYGMFLYAALSSVLLFIKRPIWRIPQQDAAEKPVHELALCAAAFLAGLYAQEWGVYILLCVFILANHKTGFYAVTALCMFIEPQPLCLITLATVYSYFLRLIFHGGAVPPREVDVLIYIFAGAIYIFNRKAGLPRTEGLLFAVTPVLYYAASAEGARDSYKSLGYLYIISAAAMSAAAFFTGESPFAGGLKNDVRAFGEFYVLSIPFAFVYAKSARGRMRNICFLCFGVLCLSFFQNLSKGAATGSVLALGIYLVLRDIRYLLPASAIAAAVLSFINRSAAGEVMGVFTQATRFQYNVLPEGGILPRVLVMGIWLGLIAVLYARTKTDRGRKPFVRSLVAAAAGGGAGFAIYGGTWMGYRLGFVFWVILSLFSAEVEEKT